MLEERPDASMNLVVRDVVPISVDSDEVRWTVIAVSQPAVEHLRQSSRRERHLAREASKRDLIEPDAAASDELDAARDQRSQNLDLKRGLRAVVALAPDERRQRRDRHERPPILRQTMDVPRQEHRTEPHLDAGRDPRSRVA